MAPAFKTQFDIHGKTADLYFECHYVDPSVGPYVLRSDISATGTAKKVNGTWLFWKWGNLKPVLSHGLSEA